MAIPRGRLITAALFAVSGCGPGLSSIQPDEPAPGTAAVQFVYQASTSLNPEVAERFPECVEQVGRTRIRASWQGYLPLDMQASGTDRWLLQFDDVPAELELAVRVNDPNACVLNPTGAATQGVLANGVLLTRVVPTPDDQPGLGFSVSSNGVVSP